MPPTLTPPSSFRERPSTLLDTAPRSRRQSQYALLDDGDAAERRRSTAVGIVLTIGAWLLCLFLFNLLITHLDSQHTAGVGENQKSKPSFDIEVDPEGFLLPKPPEPVPQNFVETNPDAPENVPDKTNNFAAQNQQAAQEKPDPSGKSDRAATEGKEDWQTNQIVDGELRQPQIQLPVAPPPMPETAQAAPSETPPPQREQNPLTGTQDIQGDSASGLGTAERKPPETPVEITPDATEQTKGLPDVPYVISLPPNTQVKIDPTRPQPRVQLNKNTSRPAVLAENKLGTQNVGLAGFDAKWSNYGQYLQKLIDTVQMQFENITERSRFWPASGTQVLIKFRIDSAGAITELLTVDGNGGSQADQICISSITDRAPYGQWTDDMVAILGDSQVLTFTFYFGRP